MVLEEDRDASKTLYAMTSARCQSHITLDSARLPRYWSPSPVCSARLLDHLTCQEEQ
jgi:hypothetical protein